jgi:hypothetical protein
VQDAGLIETMLDYFFLGYDAFGHAGRENILHELVIPLQIRQDYHLEEEYM